MVSFEYHRPTTVAEALELKDSHPEARLLAGGTDILVQMRKRLTSPAALISLRNIEELAAIDAADGVRIGAAATLTDVAQHPAIIERFPILVESIRVLGSRQIRNVATVGGNLCNASPAANTAGPLLVHEAKVELESSKGKRELALEEIFVGPAQTAIGPGELMTAILLDEPPRATKTAFLRKGRIRMDCATASVAVLLQVDGDRCTKARVAVGAVAPVPLRLKKVEELLEKTDLSDRILAEAAREAQSLVTPIDDVRSTASYRQDLIGVYVHRALATALGRA